LATGVGVLFAGMGVLRRRAGALSTSIVIVFAAVGVYCVGASAMASGVGAMFSGSSDTALFLLNV
jgi:hypothetical protein